jgi:NTP pyrophosphatase (non-canonical NTP hydrolase)
MGLNGEAGECIDLLKKHLFQGHKLDKDKLTEELGDVLWYCAELACGLSVTLEEVAQRNIEKLKKRYPEGFDAERSINREE